MTPRIRFIVALTIAIAVGSATYVAQSYEPPRGPCTGEKYRITRDMGYSKRVQRGRWVVRCVFNAVVPSQLETARDIAYRESRFDPFAHNASSDARGLFQHLGRYWQDRVYGYLDREEFPNTWAGVSAYSARANALATARIVKRHGWGPWS